MTTTTLVDLRKISSQKLDASGATGGGVITMEWVCEQQVGSQSLLEYDLVERFLYEHIHDYQDIKVKATSAYWGYELVYDLGFDIPEDIQHIIAMFRERMQHLMTCISWESCPLCESVAFTLVDPDQLDCIEEREEFTCCTLDMQKRAKHLKGQLKFGHVTQEDYDHEINELSIIDEHPYDLSP
jgi:hypothetical protein